jgi:hypothetical protein
MRRAERCQRTKIWEVDSMRTKLCLVVAGFALLLAALPVAAHHAFAAEFDANQPVKVRGVTAKMDWSNPHAWLYVDVKEPDGKIVNWRFELGAPNALIRLGWRTDTRTCGRRSGSRRLPREAGPVANGARSSWPTGGSCSAEIAPQR